jgi:hypothetical protein
LGSGRFHDNAGSNAPGAGTNAPDLAILSDMADGLEVRVPDPLGLVVGMADIVAHLRSLSAEVTLAAHLGAVLSDFESVNDSRVPRGFPLPTTGESLI